VKISIRYQILGLTVGVLGLAITLGGRVVFALLRPDRSLPFLGPGYRFRP